MAVIVQKFGGTSLSTPEQIRGAASRIRLTKSEGHSILVVASAMGQTTDRLIQLARETVAHPPQRELDMLLSAGERISMALLAMALQDLGVPAISLTGSQTGIITSSDHTYATIKRIRPVRVQEALSKGKVVIVAGFQGVSEEKEITTLGRGGSDTTAVALAAVFNALRCEILTDVDGLFSADPRIVPHARRIPYCNYDEGLELAFLGAKMHPRSLEVAQTFKVPIWIGPSKEEFISDSYGTWIYAMSERPNDPNSEMKAMVSEVEKVVVKSVTSLKNQVLVRFRGDSCTFLEAIHQRNISLRLWKEEDNGDYCFICDAEELSHLNRLAQNFAITLYEIKPCAWIALVGSGFSSSPRLFSHFIRVLKENSVQIFNCHHGSQSYNAIIAESDLERSIRLLHREFIESQADKN